jgi:hypothetical protein
MKTLLMYDMNTIFIKIMISSIKDLIIRHSRHLKEIYLENESYHGKDLDSLMKFVI